ncbi:hypothetical protein [Lentibacillus populi]|uniref:hypothetical protein n=1 Tax=Lentibacillus populi TaxID=1827502 RepID=UPI001669C3A8|nr:hypothetical protein [Lentibacillus populi]
MLYFLSTQLKGLQQVIAGVRFGKGPGKAVSPHAVNFAAVVVVLSVRQVIRFHMPGDTVQLVVGVSQGVDTTEYVATVQSPVM